MQLSKKINHASATILLFLVKSYTIIAANYQQPFLRYLKAIYLFRQIKLTKFNNLQQIRSCM